MNPSELSTEQRLLIPFKPGQISWRTGATNARSNGGKPSKGIALAYIDSRDVMRRLDDVFGIAGWQCKYTTGGRSAICNIGVKVGGEWIWRANGGAESNTEPEKGEASSAFKRAAVLFGVGRYLYQLPNVWCDTNERGQIAKPPALPEWATPEGYLAILKRQAEAK